MAGKRKKIPTVYFDTSVIGGCFDQEFAKWSNGLIDDLRNGFIRGATSEIVAAEVELAPEVVVNKYKEFIDLDVCIYNRDNYVEDLVDVYLDRKIISKKYRNDSMHIALATVFGADILVSWNFKHIVHYDKIVRFNAVNLEFGYHQLAILSPREVTTHD